MFRHFFIYYKFLGLGLLIAIVIYMLANMNGIGLTYDSLQYKAAAESFKNSGTFKNAQGDDFLPWPPLFPVLLSWIPQSIYRLVFLVTLLSTLWIYYRLAWQLVYTPSLRMVYWATILLGTPLYLVHSFLWSEPFFILLLSLQILLLYTLSYQFRLSKIILIGLLSILLCMQRNAGMIFTFGFLVALLLSEKTNKKWWAVLFFSPAFAFCLYWIFRNQNLGYHDYNFVNFDSFFSEIGKNILTIINVLSIWLFPAVIPYTLRITACSIVILLFFYTYFKYYIYHKFFTQIILLLVIYIASICLITPRLIYYSDVARFLSVVYPLFFLLLIISIERYLTLLPKKYMKLFFFVFLIWMLYPLTRTIKNALFWNTSRKTESVKHQSISEVDILISPYD